VPDAIEAIQRERFDILLSDLNIGEPGDGFTVVSAMRRIQPNSATVIMTGYPNFESALTAIRNQVDEYLTKPADIGNLLNMLKELSCGLPRTERRAPVSLKRISTVIRENRDEIRQRCLVRHLLNSELSRIPISDRQRIDHIPDFVLQIADSIECHPDQLNETIVKAATKHGASRYEQGYTIPMLLVEASILEKMIAGLLQEHLLDIDLSMLISDMHQLAQSISCAAEISIRSYLAIVEGGVQRELAKKSA
jgi:CheY-like chemotaxis protein